MLGFLKRKKKEKFEPRKFKFYGEEAVILWKLWDNCRELNTRESKYNLWEAINKRIPDTDITEDGSWEIQFGNALVFAIVETEK